ncbi:MAG TPA: tetraacyldisaccharide 4'-kinase [Polyangiaceae bacterium]|nr:tetraacyldisaccharide 4'-kinase [Polyangiaceae bacterium]
MRYSTTPRWIACRLERGALANPATRSLSRIWAACADPVRPVFLPAGPRLIGVGGATLGGSGKTPVSAALASELRAAGLRVAVIASGYRVRERVARRVLPQDAASVLGDEAVALARQLTPLGVGVFVAKHRGSALELAARGEPDLIVLDGLLQARPQPLHVALLVLDSAAPWGAGHCPPAGDLRAERSRLYRAADVLLVRREPGREPCSLRQSSSGPVELCWSDEITGARSADGEPSSIEDLRRLRVGLVLGLARPERVERELGRLGVFPALSLFYADHASLTPPRARLGKAPRVEAWLTSAKCAAKLGKSFAGSPVLVLEQRVTLPAELLEICTGTARESALRRGFFTAAPW